ncbi:Type IV fimbrial biogenesis protein PilY1 [hydrothermal vent metagenome]|uniref:Type IV fimbrial biogenesis protein PilY1 n=1 Tax=hydrothermal vent metagenome TaxID=652676 RepID=A0A3B1DRQ7_9ZZZZ
MKKLQKIYLLLSILIISIMVPQGQAFSASCTPPTLGDYTSYPPFIGSVVKPNVLILLDNSGSMFFFAYNYNGSGTSEGFTPGTDYYGYFDPDKWYEYQNSRFEETGNKSERAKMSTEWDGNFLNWLTMRRVDIARKVLVGGKAVSRSGQGNPHDLLGEQADYSSRGYLKRFTNAGDYTPYSGERCFRFNRGSSSVSKFGVGPSDGDCSYSKLVTNGYYFNVKVHLSDEPLGVLQTLKDKVRWGLEFFNTSAGGRIKTEIDDGLSSSMIAAIENERPSTWTPLAEALWTATGYFAQDSTTGDTGPRYYTSNSNSYRVGATADPFNFGTGSGGQADYVWCAKSFVLVITDGEPTQDLKLPTGIEGYYPEYTDNNDPVPSWAGADYFWSSNGSHYVDDIALWSRADVSNGKYRDLRPDLDGDQYITSYFVYAAFSGGSPDGRQLLKNAAKNGGFEDLNGDFLPDIPQEYDKNGDGDPDNYFEAQEGYALENALINALTGILSRVLSGTAVSVLTTTGEGEGAVYQAFFYPSKMEGLNEVKWLGYLQGLSVDSYGNLREDTNGNKSLDLETDLIIRTWFNEAEKKVMVDRFKDTDKNGFFDCIDSDGDGRINTSTCTNDQKVDSIDFNDITPMWEAGRLLFERDPVNRKIYTTEDGSTLLTNGFSASNSSTLRPFLRAADNTEAENIINWIRGDDLSGVTDSGHPDGYRSRTRTIDGNTGTWKLGDIIYSTPTSVARPNEKFYIYDNTYAAFRNKYYNRRTVVYAGANDGMLHAFNGGFYDKQNDAGASINKFCVGGDSNSDGIISDSECSSGTYQLGEEIWSFIPRDLLPQLKWLTDPDYTHVYYVDLKPRIADVRIFDPADDAHPGGWGTILIGGMRYGGKPLCVTDDFGSGLETRTFRSTYFALDITDPEKEPTLLWTFTDDNLGFTSVYPAIVRIGAEKWFTVFGSGPTTDVKCSRSTKGSVYVLDLTGSYGVVSDWKLSENYWKKTPAGNNNSFMADAISVDVNSDQSSDVVYIGTAYEQGNALRGRMLRLVTQNSTDPATWTLSTLYDPGKPVTASPSASLDGDGNLWVFFGTGKFLDQSDKVNTDQQAFYGIKDVCKPWVSGNYSCTDTVNQGDLINVSNAIVSTGGGTIAGVSGVANWTELTSEINSSNGWYIDFPISGERSFVKPLVMGGLVAWATYMPETNLCSPEGESNVYVVYYETGTAFRNHVFVEDKGTEKSTVDRRKSIGKGAPSSIVGMITKRGTLKGFAQTSTGEIKEFELDAPIKPYNYIQRFKRGGIQ